jgi:hypothetical protein
MPGSIRMASEARDSSTLLELDNMYVRWKTKDLARSADGSAGRSLYAVLVASERRNGKPRQRVLKHLAYINERDLSCIEQRRRFWLQADRSLATVEVNAPLRKNILDRLNEVVPCPADTTWLKDNDHMVAVVEEMLPQIETIIDWNEEMQQLPGSCVVCQGHDRTRYIITPDIFSRMNPITRSRIRRVITWRSVSRSLSHITRIVKGRIPTPRPANGGVMQTA